MPTGSIQKKPMIPTPSKIVHKRQGEAFGREMSESTEQPPPTPPCPIGGVPSDIPANRSAGFTTKLHNLKAYKATGEKIAILAKSYPGGSIPVQEYIERLVHDRIAEDWQSFGPRNQ